MISYYYFAENGVDEAIAQLEKAPEFFEAAIQWAIDASYMYIGFVAGLALVVGLFRR